MNHQSSSMKWIPKRSGAIEITPIPTVKELNAHAWGEEFHACLMKKAEFETIWENRSYSGAFLNSEE